MQDYLYLAVVSYSLSQYMQCYKTVENYTSPVFSNCKGQSLDKYHLPLACFHGVEHT